MTTNLTYQELLKGTLRIVRDLDFSTLRMVWHFLQGVQRGQKK